MLEDTICDMSKHRRIVSADHTPASKSAQRRMSASRGLGAGAFDLSSFNLNTAITPVDEKAEKIEELFKEIANEVRIFIHGHSATIFKSYM